MTRYEALHRGPTPAAASPFSQIPPAPSPGGLAFTFLPTTVPTSVLGQAGNRRAVPVHCRQLVHPAQYNTWPRLDLDPASRRRLQRGSGVLIEPPHRRGASSPRQGCGWLVEFTERGGSRRRLRQSSRPPRPLSPLLPLQAYTTPGAAPRSRLRGPGEHASARHSDAWRPSVDSATPPLSDGSRRTAKRPRSRRLRCKAVRVLRDPRALARRAPSCTASKIRAATSGRLRLKADALSAQLLAQAVCSNALCARDTVEPRENG